MTAKLGAPRDRGNGFVGREFSRSYRGVSGVGEVRVSLPSVS